MSFFFATIRGMKVYIRPYSYVCNMSCDNCLEQEMKSKRNLDDGVLMDTSLFDKIIRNDLKEVSYYFVGGEPLLVPLSFYQEFVSKVNNICDFIIETNGTLIDQTWINFFKKNHFIVRLKVDLEASNIYKVMDAFRLLKRNNLNVIVVSKITKRNYQNAEHLMNFYLSEGIDFVSLVFANRFGYELDSKMYAHFCIAFFKSWKKSIENGKYIHVDYFNELIENLKGQKHDGCCNFGKCDDVLVFNSDGKEYSCPYYAFDNYVKDETLSKQCLDCPYVKACFGGCLRERKIIYHDDYCGKKEFINNCIEEIKELIAN